MSNYIKIANDIIDVVKDSGIYSPRLSSDEITKRIDQLSDIAQYEAVDPFLILADITNLDDGIFIADYDDCNIYQETGYYKNILNNISQKTKNKICISNITEDWDEEGNVQLAFTVYNSDECLEFNTREDIDLVPAAFTEKADQILMAYKEEFSFLKIIDGGGGTFYHLLPSDLANKLNKITGEYEPR